MQLCKRFANAAHDPFDPPHPDPLPCGGPCGERERARRLASVSFIHEGTQRLRYSKGTMAASLQLRSVNEVFTLRTCGAAVSSATKAWKAVRSGATHLRMKSISPDSIQHSRTSGRLRTKASNSFRSASAWLVRCTMAKAVT